MFLMNYKNAVESGFIPYILEASGRVDLCDTRTSKINAIIKDFKYLVKQGKNPNDYISIVLAKYGLKEENLTNEECKKIMRCVDGTY